MKLFTNIFSADCWFNRQARVIQHLVEIAVTIRTSQQKALGPAHCDTSTHTYQTVAKIGVGPIIVFTYKYI